jgi:hypothetical protein
MFRALLAHPQEETALGILRAEISRCVEVLMYVLNKA